MEKFKKGDRVILTNTNINPTKSWPVWGSEHECVGVIVDIANDLVWVNWGNDSFKMILSSSLSHFTGQEQNSLSPNIAFLKYKRETNEDS